MLDHFPRHRLFRQTQLIRLLQIHPEFSRGVEERGQAHRGVARDAALPFDNGGRNIECLGQAIGVDGPALKVSRIPPAGFLLDVSASFHS